MKTNLNLLLFFCLLAITFSCETGAGEISIAKPEGALESIDIIEPFQGEEQLLLKYDEFTPSKAPIVKEPSNGGSQKIRSITRVREYGVSSSSAAQQEFLNSIIECGSQKSGSTEDNNFNTNDDVFYSRHLLTTNLDGNDRSYYIFVDQPKNYTFHLSKASTNLAMVLFKANITSPADNGTDQATEETQGMVAYSTSSSTMTEKLGPVYLDKGEYVLVIDSKPGQGSSFDLSVSCADAFIPCSGKFGNGLIAETFEQYRNYADLSQLSSNWEDFSPQQGLNAFTIYTAGRRSRTDALLMYRRFATGNTVSANEPNVIFTLGERNSGKYALEFDLGVYGGYSAYFNLVNFLTERNANNEVGAEFFFPSSGHGAVRVNGQIIPFNYRNGYWQTVKIVWDFPNNNVKMYLNNNPAAVASWQADQLNTGGTGFRSVEGVNFLPAYSNTAFLVDNFCFSQQ